MSQSLFIDAFGKEVKETDIVAYAVNTYFRIAVVTRVRDYRTLIVKYVGHVWEHVPHLHQSKFSFSIKKQNVDRRHRTIIKMDIQQATDFLEHSMEEDYRIEFKKLYNKTVGWDAFIL